MLIAALLCGATFIVFYPVVHGGFFVMDDGIYVFQNPTVRSGLSLHSLAWAFSNLNAGMYIPATWLSLMCDASLFGDEPWGFHLTNAILHAVNAGALFLLLLRMTGSPWRSAIAAALFAVHPLRVESVAWVTERKDVLAGFFGLLALHAYVSHVRRPSSLRYLGFCAGYALSLLAKPMLVTLPIVLLALDFWPLRRLEDSSFRPSFSRITRLLLEKLLPLACAAAISLATLFGQKAPTVDMAPFPLRAKNAVVSLAQYVGSFFWVDNLAPLYSIPFSIPAWQVVLAALFLIAVTVICCRLARRHPHLLVGWVWFVVLLAPTLGVVRNGIPVSVADRFTYFPQIGLLMMAIWSLPQWLWNRQTARMALLAGVAALLIALASFTRRQIGWWRDDLLLAQHGVAVTHGDCAMLGLYGRVLERKGRHADAAEQYRAALAIYEYPGLRVSLAKSLMSMKQYASARAELQRALQIDPRKLSAWTTMGTLAFTQHHLDEARSCFTHAVEIDPSNVPANFNLATLLRDHGEKERAMIYLHNAADGFPPTFTPNFEYGRALLDRGNARDATIYLQRAVELSPASTRAHQLLAIAFDRTGRRADAAREMDLAARSHLSSGIAPQRSGHDEAAPDE